MPSKEAEPRKCQLCFISVIETHNRADEDKESFHHSNTTKMRLEELSSLFETDTTPKQITIIF